MSQQYIHIKGARQNNLKNLDLKIPLNSLVVVTGVSGSGKSSLAFDTIYAEGQRRYVETFSPYARQFLDRMDRPQVDKIEGIPPSIAIDQANPVRTSRSTVGTMTELNDHLKLLFARTAKLYCHGCGKAVEKDTPASIYHSIADENKQHAFDGIAITFTISIPDNFSEKEIIGFLEQNGYTKTLSQQAGKIEVIQDRVKFNAQNKTRIIESLELALRNGHGHVDIHAMQGREIADIKWRFSDKLHCASCDLDYTPVQPSHFSFNSPIGACDTCRGFGRTIGINYGLVVPNQHISIAEGAIKPFQTPSSAECQDDLMRFAKKKKFPVNTPWKDLAPEQKEWVLDGEGDWDEGVWYGVKRFFKWLESKSYKMHIRVLLAKYRAYDECNTCQGSRLKPHALLWRIGQLQNTQNIVANEKRFMPAGFNMSNGVFEKMPGLSMHDVMQLPIETCLELFNTLILPKPYDEATELLLEEIQTRLNYLVDVGLGYLTLDRQSRTLSGGEVQRINLTTALGSSLVNTLFVLDEPSIGLHSRDIERMIGILRKLRDAGNSLIVVEHDADIMRSADYILDIGPGPGEDGGKKVFFGTPNELLARKNSITGQYLSGTKQLVNKDDESDVPDSETVWLGIKSAAENNLKNIDVEFPLGRISCLTGVSGSGKSTLLHDVIYAGIQKQKGQQIEYVGKHEAITGIEHFDSVHIVDQSQIGKTTRSNPVSYVGAWEDIRKAFAQQPMALERNYTAGTFSFNSGNGRCPSCSGNGFEHIEMQFLSDVYIRCSDCNGSRYRKEILDITLLAQQENAGSNNLNEAKSIADVLTLSVTQAIDFFRDYPAVVRSLQPLVDVGLGYIGLGQPVPTLSGGEAQRLKLAGHLAKTVNKTSKSSSINDKLLFLFDEPSTGLHFQDIQVLLSAFNKLKDAGHSLIIIEHNLDIIAASDWVVDLGPEGGNGGGKLMTAGSPRDIAANTASETGQALAGYFKAKESPTKFKPLKTLATPKTRSNDNNQFIKIHNAREHNLKNIDVTIPREKMTVITGLSGSGKSTIAFDILFAEGQRRYLESLNAYARQFVQPAGRADIDAIYGIPPTVAIEQRTSRGGHKSTVATVTEIYHFLRLLYVKLGVQYCPACDIPIDQQTPEQILAQIYKRYRNKTIRVLSPMVTNRKGYYTDLAAWAAGKGYDHMVVDGVDTPTNAWPRLDRYKEHNIDLPVASIMLSAKNEAQLREIIAKALSISKGVLKVETAKTKPQLFSIHRACTACGESFDELDPRLFSYNSKHGWCETCHGNGVLTEDDEEENVDDVDEEAKVCSSCNGERLNPMALSVRYKNKNIAEFTQLTVADAHEQIKRLRPNNREKAIAQDIFAEMLSRLHFLKEVGLSYLNLGRSAPSLSGGEAQRIRLAAQLGTNLQGVCYILDEPTIGLHPRDNKLLLKSLKQLEKKGNTLVIVEHDEDTIEMAEHIIDLGPGAGKLGGEIIAEGSLKQLMGNAASITGQCIKHPLLHPLRGSRRDNKAEMTLMVKKASLHNLRNFNLEIPLQRFVAVTGVSGSGKSTLVRHLLLKNLQERVGKKITRAKYIGCEKLTGWENLNRILEVDQTPIGKTPRSCPATYIGFWDKIRKLFADTPEARIRGYNASRFSFNTKEGCCPSCGGQGTQRIEMSFLPNVAVKCDTCNGKRFTDDTLEITYKNKNISDVLNMNIDEAVDYFSTHRSIHVSLKLLQEVGLGYLTLGQASPTLSGGEAQRIKLVTELSKSFITRANEINDIRPIKSRQHTLFILDEPTVGLHMADVEKLLRVLHQLVDAGNSLIVIEHNLDIIAEADYLIDIGPEGGKDGGKVVAKGTPEVVAKVKSETGKILSKFLRQRKNRKSA